MKRKALFVGIDNYTRGIPALSCARNDANALLEYFLKHGYAEDDVSILRDGRTSEILDELDEQTKRLKPGDLFLFFFAGHGYTIEKSDGSFDRCLAGADDRRDRIMRGKEGISLSEIKDRADKARCPFVVILDACQTKIDTSRAADLFRKDVCNQRDLLAISSVVNRKSTGGQSIPFVVINSCDVGEVAYELEEKEQGLFTFSMLETLKQMDNPAFDERLLALISSRMGEHGSGYSQHPKLMLADTSDILDIPIFPAADSPHETLVLCPVCGFRNREEQTFRCRVCGRDYLCTAHFDKLERCCEDCAAMKRRERAERETAERRAREEEERKAREAVECKGHEVSLQNGTCLETGVCRTLTLPGGAEMEMIYCSPGEFTMGSPANEEGRKDDETQHRVRLTDGFWLGKYLVTQRQWKGVMRNRPSEYRGDNLPVESVSWDDCQKFIAKVNASLGCGARLPTEAEWEYACRAGTTTAYFWGNALNGDKANCDGNYPCGTKTKGPYLENTTPVGRYAPNWWGFYDMHGNVCEWCNDRYGDYPSGSVTNPTGPATGSYRVLRGGSWCINARHCRSASRDWSFPGNRFHNRGFRLCCSAGPCG